MVNNSDDLWGPVSLDNWEDVLFIKGRVATEEDVKLGRAVFYINNEKSKTDHGPIDIQIPSLAHHIDQETGERTLVVVIQAEKANEQEVVGLRYFEGGNGACLLFELEFVQ
jgi:hypothetical protein